MFDQLIRNQPRVMWPYPFNGMFMKHLARERHLRQQDAHVAPKPLTSSSQRRQRCLWNELLPSWRISHAYTVFWKGTKFHDRMQAYMTRIAVYQRKANFSQLSRSHPLMILTGKGTRRYAMLHRDSNMLSAYLSADFHARHRTPCLRTRDNVNLFEEFWLHLSRILG